MSYNFGKTVKTEKTEMVEIFCGVNYSEKDLAKEKGAKWNIENKKWFFSFPLNDFVNNVNLHTYQFKPFSIGISISYAKENGEVARVQLIDNCYRIAKNRNIKYLDGLENKNIEDIKPKEIWQYACTFCKENKLSAEEIKEMKEYYIFNKEPCLECKTNYYLSKYI